MKLRIFKKDDILYFDYPSEKYQNNVEQCKIPPSLEGCEYITVDHTIFDKFQANGADLHMYYFDGAVKEENLKQDVSWEKCLMPSYLIRGKHISKLEKTLDNLISNNISDPLEILKLQREKEKSLKFSKEEWHEQALKNLDARVANGEPDKPVIREKLLAKIEQLKK